MVASRSRGRAPPDLNQGPADLQSATLTMGRRLRTNDSARLCSGNICAGDIDMATDAFCPSG